MPAPDDHPDGTAPSNHLLDLARMIRGLDDLVKDDSGSVPAPSLDDKDS